jgi:hypothetical protein
METRKKLGKQPLKFLSLEKKTAAEIDEFGSHSLLLCVVILLTSLVHI